ncbi:MAG: Sjogren's syndrome/scleroderma autoantigen 1 family protein [Conexivisphaerales archaeon]
MVNDSRSSQKFMAEMLKKGATLLREPCPECGGIIFRYRGSDVCPSCSGITNMEELDEAAAVKEAPPSGRAEIVAKVLDGTLAQLAREKDPAKKLRLLQMAKLGAELVKLLKD